MLQRVMIAIAISCDPRAAHRRRGHHGARRDHPGGDHRAAASDLRDQRGLAVLFVSHDLAVIRELCDRVVVFYAGEVVEAGPVEEIIERPRHPYTQALLRVASVGDFQRRELQVIPGQPPQVGAQITGCRFAARCPAAVDACRAGDISLTRLGAGARGALRPRQRPALRSVRRRRRPDRRRDRRRGQRRPNWPPDDRRGDGGRRRRPRRRCSRSRTSTWSSAAAGAPATCCPAWT